MVVGLQDRDEQPVRPSSRTTGNRTCESDAVSEFSGPLNASPVNSGMITPAARMKNAVTAPRTISMIQNSVEARRNASLLAPLLQQFGEHRHERRRQRRVGEQVGDQVGHLEGERERRRRPLRAEEARRDDFAQQPDHARDAGGDREDRRVAGDAAATRRRRDGRLLRRGFSGLRQGRYSTALRGAPEQFDFRASRSFPWPTSTHRRSASCAPSASVSRTAATPRRSRRYFRRLESLVEDGDDAAADTTHRELVSTIDKAVKRGALHRNTGARKKSRAARLRAGSSTE